MRSRESAGDGEIVLVQDYQLALTAGQLRKLRPDLRVVHFTHTPFAGPDDFSLLPTDVGEALCRALASRPAGFHTKRWADAYRQSARAALGRRASVPAPFAASLGARRRRARRGRGDARSARRGARASPTRSATGS